VVAGAGAVASLVVVPLVVNGLAFGAFYFTLSCPSDFVNIQDTLLSFTASVTLTIHNKLAGRTRRLCAVMTEVRAEGGRG
jgi:hypothetical protein